MTPSSIPPDADADTDVAVEARPDAPAPADDGDGLPLFYTRPRVLQPGLHGRLSISAQAGYRHAAGTNAVPLVAQELPVACRHFPIVFSEGGSSPHPMAVLGLQAGRNAFVDDEGHWRDGAYIPAYVRRYPFIFLENEARSELTLCIDEAAPQLVEGRANPLFDEAGKPTALTQGALTFCRDYQAQHLATLAFGAALEAADLLVENRADVTLPSGQRMSLSGFRVIDEARFEQLPETELRRWREQGWVKLVYAHFISIGGWSDLLDRERGVVGKTGI